jgi:hypothetical protein
MRCSEERAVGASDSLFFCAARSSEVIEISLAAQGKIAKAIEIACKRWDRRHRSPRLARIQDLERAWFGDHRQ